MKMVVDQTDQNSIEKILTIFRWWDAIMSAGSQVTISESPEISINRSIHPSIDQSINQSIVNQLISLYLLGDFFCLFSRVTRNKIENEARRR